MQGRRLPLRMDECACENHAHQCGKSSHLLPKMKLICLDQGLRTQTSWIMYPYIPVPAAPLPRESLVGRAVFILPLGSALLPLVLCWLFLCAPWLAVL